MPNKKDIETEGRRSDKKGEAVEKRIADKRVEDMEKRAADKKGETVEKQVTDKKGKAADKKGGDMQIGLISVRELPYFASLLLLQTAEQLREGQPVTALGLVQDQTACGAVAGYLEGERFLVTSLYVAPAYRRRGGGRLLMETLHGLVENESGAEEAELRFTVTTEEHRSLLPFLNAIGYSREDPYGKNIYLTTVGKTADSPFFAKAKKSGLCLAEMGDVELALLEKSGPRDSMRLPPGGLRSPEIDREVSVAAVENNRLMGLAVLDHSCCGTLTLASLWSAPGNPQLVVSLLRSALARVKEKYPPQTPLAFQTVTPASVRLIRGLLPDAEPVSYIYYRPMFR